MDLHIQEVDSESFLKETLSMSLNKHLRLRFLVIIFLILNLVLTIAIASIGYIQMADHEKKYKSQVAEELQSVKMLLSMNIKSSLSNLFFISEVIDKEINQEQRVTREITEDLLYSFVKNNDSYDQGRFLDANGMEIVRVNKIEGSVPYVVPDENLQDKSNRPYFTETVNLSTNIAYISQLDLNIENGKVEIPYKLVLRMATPIYSKGIVEGVIILNFLGSEMLLDALYILRQGQGEAVDKYFLLNSKGEPLSYLRWVEGAVEQNLLGPDASEAFKETFNISSNEISKFKDGVFSRDNSIFAKTTIRVDITASASNNKFGLIRKNIVFPSDHDKSDLILISVTKWNSYLHTVQTFVKDNYIGIIWVEAIFIMVAFFYSRNIVKQKILENAIKSAAAYDPLTSLYNRRFGILFVKYEMRKIARSKDDLTLFVLDVNNLKGVNDSCGHSSGDELIKIVSERLRTEIRDSDIVARIGGDEFIVAFSGMNLEFGTQALERIRAGLASEHRGYFKGIGVDFSFGGVEYDKEKYGCFEEFLKDADAAMYIDKRNRKHGRGV